MTSSAKEKAVAPSATASAGPYDLAVYLARSLGRALPIVLIIALVGVGTWFFLDKVYLLQVQLLDAERRRNDAELLAVKASAAASAAADRSEIQTLRSNRQQILDLNTAAVATSKDLQILVQNQLEGIKRTEEIARLQQDKTQAFQAQLEQAVRRDLERLNGQIASTEKRARELAILQYQRLIDKMQLRMGIYKTVDDQLIDLLQLQVDDPIVQEQLEKDLTDKNMDWRIQLILALEKFRRQPTEANAKRATSLPSTKDADLTTAIADIYGAFLSNSLPETAIITPSILRIISNSSLPKELRVSIVKKTIFRNPRYTREDYLRLASRDERESSARFLRDLFAEQMTTQYNADCTDLEFLGDAIEKLTPLRQKVDISSGTRPADAVYTSPGDLCSRRLQDRYDDKIRFIGNPYPRR